MKINRITLKSGQKIAVPHLTVIVGPNNVGKSQFLRDIYSSIYLGNSTTNVLIQDLDFGPVKSIEELFQGVKYQQHPVHKEEILCQGIGPDLISSGETSVNRDRLLEAISTDIKNVLSQIGRLKVAYLSTGPRLNIATEKDSISPDQSPTNLMQAYANADKEIRDELERIFQISFGMKISFDSTNHRNFRFKVAREFEKIPDPSKAFDIMNKYPRLDVQGDGFVSFVGVILSLLLSDDRIILLDEPEAFLHPTQAKILGNWIATHAKNHTGQILIATHNSNFLAGLLSTDTEVGIYRLNRIDDTTIVRTLSTEAVANLSKAPLLSSQPVLESVFYTGVVVCEGDSDRCLYQLVSIRDLDFQEFLFIHAHEKNSIKKVVSLIRNAGIPVSIIVDLDIVNSGSELKALLSTVTDSIPNEIVEIQEKLFKAVMGQTEKEVLTSVRKQISNFYDELTARKHNLAGARGALNRIKQVFSKWDKVKRHGIQGFPSLLRKDARRLIEILKDYQIYLVPVGELEGWIDLGTQQKGRWIIEALQTVSKGNSPTKLRKFVKEIIIQQKNH